MIKGHMTIELADGKTGEVVERHEDDNLVTNGIKHYFKNMGFMNPTPIYNTTGQLIANNPQNLAIPLFGGLLLFDTAQTENAEHIFVSGGTKMTAGVGFYHITGKRYYSVCVSCTAQLRSVWRGKRHKQGY